jgi:hypothetical protein
MPQGNNTEALKLWQNSAYGKWAERVNQQPSPETTHSRSVEPPRGESEVPRIKPLGAKGYTEMGLKEVAEMFAEHPEHFAAPVPDCACVELVTRALFRVMQSTAAIAGARDPMDERRWLGMVRDALDML